MLEYAKIFDVVKRRKKGQRGGGGGREATINRAWHKEKSRIYARSNNSL